MKAKTNYGLGPLSGARDNTVFYSIPGYAFTIMRARPEKIQEAQQHEDFRTIGHNMFHLNPSQNYKDDFKVYNALYHQLPQARPGMVSWYNLYNSLMWDLHRASVLNLKTITRQQIYDQNLPCISVKAAVEAGFLPEVTNYQMLDKTI